MLIWFIRKRAPGLIFRLVWRVMSAWDSGQQEAISTKTALNVHTLPLSHPGFFQERNIEMSNIE